MIKLDKDTILKLTEKKETEIHTLPKNIEKYTQEKIVSEKELKLVKDSKKYTEIKNHINYLKNIIEESQTKIKHLEMQTAALKKLSAGKTLETDNEKNAYAEILLEWYNEEYEKYEGDLYDYFFRYPQYYAAIITTAGTFEFFEDDLLRKYLEYKRKLEESNRNYYEELSEIMKKANEQWECSKENATTALKLFLEIAPSPVIVKMLLEAGANVQKDFFELKDIYSNFEADFGFGSYFWILQQQEWDLFQRHRWEEELENNKTRIDKMRKESFNLMRGINSSL